MTAIAGLQPDPKTDESNVLKYGDTMYLQHMSGRYIVASEHGKIRRQYNWPKLGNTNKVKFQILGAEGELTDGAIIKLKSLESGLGDRNILGAWPDSQDCYYWKDNYNPKKQGWQITKRNRSGDNKIRYGDDVFLTNLHYKNKRLVRCTWYDGFVSTSPYANEWWTIKAEGKQDDVEISSEGAFLERLFEPNTRTFSKANLAYMAYCAEAVYSSPEESKARLEYLGFKINGHEHFLDFPDTNTQGIMVGDDEKIIIAFRGTENLSDWRTNMKLLKATWKVGMVHAGFYKSLDSVWPEAIKRLESLRTNKQPIWVTGHSLGGALATLAAATLDQEFPDYEIAGIYTFGQPRVGDMIFAQSLDKGLKARFFRTVNNNDMVPRIPRVRFRHVGTLLYFDCDGNLHDDMVISWLSPRAWQQRFKGYYNSLFNLDSDDVGDHRMGDYCRLSMRQLEGM